jgi:hypothetical protein
MPGPFPGMDPYLESPANWRNFHASFIARLAEALNNLMPKEYVARIEERLYIIPWSDYIYPDVAILSKRSVEAPSHGATAVLIEADSPHRVVLLREDRQHETYIDVISVGKNPRVVLTVELLSPANKSRGRGHAVYAAKADKLLTSQTHLVEIDLLRGGRHTVAPPRSVVVAEAGDYHYIVSLHRGGDGPRFDFWSWKVWERLPRLALPLDPGVPDVVLDLQTAFDRNFDAGRLAQQIDYTREPEPPFTGDDALWLDALLREKGFRA